MAIDSARLLADSAAQIYRRLPPIQPLEGLDLPFEEWLGALVPTEPAEEQALRRDYRRVRTLIDELTILVCSRSQALALVRTSVEAESEP